MKKIIVPILIFTLAGSACKQPKKTLLAGKWQAVKFENPEMNYFFENSAHLLDTMGSHTDSAANVDLYGSNNIDSLRNNLRMNREQAMMMQNATIEHTVFTFTKDILTIDFNGRVDSGKWHFEEGSDTRLEMEELAGPDNGAKIEIELLSLTQDSLKLKIPQDTSYSIISFYRLKN